MMRRTRKAQRRRPLKGSERAVVPRDPARRGAGRQAGGTPSRREGFGTTARGTVRRGRLGGALLDRHSDEASPLRPRSVVITHALVAEQVLEHEPGVRTALADAAVRDGLAFPVDALTAVDLTELLGALEAAVLGDGGRPRNVLRSRDVAPTLRAFLWQVLRREEPARVFLGRPGVDALRAASEYPLQHVFAARSHLCGGPRGA